MITSCLILGCIFDQEGKSKNQNNANSSAQNHRIVVELTIEEDAAFEALNKLQMNSDNEYRLYSTFANHVQPCFPADTSITITRAELLKAMKEFAQQYYSHLDKAECNKLINSSVMAQDEYRVLHCVDNLSKINYSDGVPMTGIWVMPNILGRRDIILEW